MTEHKKSGRKPQYLYKAGDRFTYLMLTGKCYMVGCERYVEVICDCSKIMFKSLTNIKRGNITSCGCRRREVMSKRQKTHGLTKINGIINPIYSAWMSMKQRCKGQSSMRNKKYYKDKGVTVCQEWLDSFEVFNDWAIKNGWEKGLSLDRINGDGNYSPLNCRWGTDEIQNRNRSNNYILEAFGERKCLSEWVQDIRCEVHANTIKSRIENYGWEVERAISTPSKFKMWQS